MKIRNSRLLAMTRQLGMELAGPHGTITGPGSLTGGAVQQHTLFSPGPMIYGGTDEFQRNIIGERGLGLPREPGPARDTPFRELLHNPAP